MNVLDDLLLLETTADVDKMAADFLAHIPAKRHDIARKALEKILPIYAGGGSIFNVDLESAKKVLNRSFEDGFDALDNKLSYSDRSELGFGLSLHSIPSLIKKLNGKGPKDGGWEATPEHLEKVKQFMAAMLPISLALSTLKKQVVKGKKPLPPEKAAAKAAQLALKDIKTCACCFRPIATLPNGLIADHGYTIPHPGRKGGSCPGRKFRPLEVSSDGLKHMIEMFETWIASTQKALKEAPQKTKILKKSYSTKASNEVVEKGSPEWDHLYKQYVTDLMNSLERDQEQLKKFINVLTNWKPAAVESLRELTLSLDLLL